MSDPCDSRQQGPIRVNIPLPNRQIPLNRQALFEKLLHKPDPVRTWPKERVLDVKNRMENTKRKMSVGL
jgi:hypothetical protein